MVQQIFKSKWKHMVGVICLNLTTGTQVTTREGDIISAGTVHWVGAGLVCFYILAALAILAMVFSGVKKLIS